MKTDTLFYRLFKHYPSLFFRLAGEPAELAGRYTFSSVELKETQTRIDGLFVPKGASPVYFAEVQF
ncbi:MAG: DUF2887 domain-containing protein [Rhizobacter sp.]|nr:DUF2887 domain-containing protein [Chlorobiales bacterium]